MARHQENRDERIAGEWLELQGHRNIEKQTDDPPDFVVDGKYAVEVRRLNSMIEIDGKTKGEEESQIPLREEIEEVLEKFGPLDDGWGWHVNCEYDFQESEIPPAKDVQKEISQALHELLRSPHPAEHSLDPKLIELKCGIRLELFPGRSETAFALNDVSDGMGIMVLDELIKSVPFCMNEKRGKVAARKNRHREWWLLLIDHIGFVPRPLSENELSILRKEVPLQEPFSRVVIVSSWNPEWYYEL